MTALTRYRLRPVTWGRLALGSAVLAGLCAWLYENQAAMQDAYRSAVVVACLAGLGAATLAAPETDPHADAQEAVPVPAWRTAALRLAAWLALGLTVLVAFAVLLGGSRGWSGGQLLLGTVPAFGLVSAVCFAVAGRSSALAGSASALGTLAALELAARLKWFPVRLAVLPTEPLFAVSRAWLLGLAALLLAGALLERGRRGLGLVGRTAARAQAAGRR